MYTAVFFFLKVVLHQLLCCQYLCLVRPRCTHRAGYKESTLFLLPAQRMLNPALPEPKRGGLSSSLTNSFLAGGTCSRLMKMLHCALILCSRPAYSRNTARSGRLFCHFGMRALWQTHTFTVTGSDEGHLKYFFFPSFLFFSWDKTFINNKGVGVERPPLLVLHCPGYGACCS